MQMDVLYVVHMHIKDNQIIQILIKYSVLQTNLSIDYVVYNILVNIQNTTAKRGDIMAVHHGGKIGKAAKTLASKSSSSKAKSSAAKVLANHKATKH